MAARASDLRQLRDRRSTSQDPSAMQAMQVKTAGSDGMIEQEQTQPPQWEEPSLAKKPSYQEHNGVLFYGVVDHMQTLGEAPSGKVKGRVRPEVPRKSIVGRSSVAAGQDARETPEGTPTPAPPPMTAREESIKPPAVVIDDAQDADYAPAKKQNKDATIKTRGTKRRADADPSTELPPDDRKISKATSSSSTKKKNSYDPTKLKRVVESAKERAMAVGRPELAAAVHEIWVQSVSNDRLLDLLQRIVSSTASKKQVTEFQSYVKAAKKRLKEQGVGSAARKLPLESANGAQQSLPLRSPSNFTSADTLSTALPSTEKHLPGKSKSYSRIKSLKKHAKPHRSGHTAKTSASPQKMGQTSRAGSESSLTSLTSNGDDMDVDEHELQNGTGRAGPAPVDGIKTKDHAAERGSLAAPDRNQKRSSADADLADEERERTLAAKKRKLRENQVGDIQPQESDIRVSVRQPPARTRTQKLKHSTLVPPPMSLTPNGTHNVSTRGSRTVSTDPDSPLSDLSPPSSRLSTPHIYRGPPKPTGKRAKTKTSPEKKHSTGYGGLSGAGGAGRESPIGDDDNEELSENNDFCSACGGSGYLLCCDGCDRSFHFSCLDPPLNEDASELNEPWYCYICVAKRPVASESPEKPQSRLFAPLFSSLKKRNPSNFALPHEIIEYFEGVGADKSGNFIEAVGTRTRNRSGYDEQPDYTKIKDGKGNTILCYSCGKSSNGTRQIIQCDYCSENWHLDCLDPPLANPPARSSIDGKKLHDWMCPLHADHELRRVDARLLNPRRLGRTIHVRKPRNAKVVDTALGRGFRNNGIIEVQDDESDDSDSEFYDEETPGEATVFRMPASGIKLDFIDKIKNTRVQEVRNERVFKKARTNAYVNTPTALEQANFARRSFVEKQLALNLAQFASANKDLDLGRDQVENLIGTLIAEAPPQVVEQMTAVEEAEKASQSKASRTIPPSPPSSDQTDPLSAELRRELEMLQELIRRRLESGKT